MKEALFADEITDDASHSKGRVFKNILRRLIARTIDAVVISVGLWSPVLWGVFGGHLGPDDGNRSAAILVPLVFVYEVVMLSTCGGTVGKLAVGCRVRSRSGERITWLKAFVRSLLLAAGAFVWPLYVLALIASFFGKNRQLPYDRLARTAVSVIPLSRRVRRVIRASIGAVVVYVAPILLLLAFVEWTPVGQLGYAGRLMFLVVALPASSTLLGVLIARRDAGAVVAIGFGIPSAVVGIVGVGDSIGSKSALLFVAMGLAASLQAAHLGRRFFKPMLLGSAAEVRDVPLNGKSVTP